MIGALCASENSTLHSLWMAFLTPSWTLYSFASPSTILRILRTLLLCGFFTVHFIRYHILLLSSLLHFCICVVSSPLCLQGSPRDAPFLRPFACFQGSVFRICAKFFRSIYMLLPCKLQNVSGVIGVPLFYSYQLKIGMYPIIPCLYWQAEVAVRS